MSPAREDPPDSRRYVRLWVGALVVLTGLTLFVQRDPEPGRQARAA